MKKITQVSGVYFLLKNLALSKENNWQ